PDRRLCGRRSAEPARFAAEPGRSARGERVASRGLFKDDLGTALVQWRTRRGLNHALKRIRAGATPWAACTGGYSGSDGLVKTAGRVTGQPRALTKNLAKATREGDPRRQKAA